MKKPDTKYKTIVISEEQYGLLMECLKTNGHSHSLAAFIEKSQDAPIHPAILKFWADNSIDPEEIKDDIMVWGYDEDGDSAMELMERDLADNPEYIIRVTVDIINDREEEDC